MGGFIPQQEQGYIGDNKEITVATTGEITLWFYRTGYSSVNDNITAREYYFDKQKVARKFVIRTNQTITITEMNGTVLTDPTTIAIGDGTVIPASGYHKEEFDDAAVYSIKLNILTADTELKIRKY